MTVCELDNALVHRFVLRCDSPKVVCWRLGFFMRLFQSVWLPCSG